MRVLHILEATGGGTARHVVDLIEGLTAMGVENHLVYSSLRADAFWRAHLGALERRGVSLLEVPMRRSPHPSDLKALATVASYVAREAPFDIFHGHSSKGGALARALKIFFPSARVVYNPHAFVTLSPRLKPAEKLLYSMVERGLGLLTDGFILGSSFEHEEFLRLGLSGKAFRIIPPTGIRPLAESPANRESVRRAWGLRGDEVVFGFVGRLDHQKAPEVALEAFARFVQGFPGETRFVMVGEGRLHGELRSRVRELGLEGKVIFPGYQEGRSVMPGFDVFVLSSLYESAGIVLLEAADAGLPILTTPVGWARDIVAHGVNGFIYPIGDYQALAHYMHLLASDGSLRKAMGEESRRRASGITLDRTFKETYTFYKEILKKEGAW